MRNFNETVSQIDKDKNFSYLCWKAGANRHQPLWTNIPGLVLGNKFSAEIQKEKKPKQTPPGKTDSPNISRKVKDLITEKRESEEH